MQCMLCITCPLDVLQVPEDLLLLRPAGVQLHLPPRGVIVAGVAHLLVAHELCLSKQGRSAAVERIWTASA